MAIPAAKILSAGQAWAMATTASVFIGSMGIGRRKTRPVTMLDRPTVTSNPAAGTLQATTYPPGQGEQRAEVAQGPPQLMEPELECPQAHSDAALSHTEAAIGCPPWCLVLTRLFYLLPKPDRGPLGGRRLRAHSPQYTGRSSLGTNGSSLISVPHSAHFKPRWLTSFIRLRNSLMFLHCGAGRISPAAHYLISHCTPRQARKRAASAHLLLRGEVFPGPWEEKQAGP